MRLGIITGQRQQSDTAVLKRGRRKVEYEVEVLSLAQVQAFVLMVDSLTLGVDVIERRLACRQRISGGHLIDMHYQLRVTVVQGHIAVGSILAAGNQRIGTVEGLGLARQLIRSAEVGLRCRHIIDAVEASSRTLHVGRLAVMFPDTKHRADALGGNLHDGTTVFLLIRGRSFGIILCLSGGNDSRLVSIERQVKGSRQLVVRSIGHNGHYGIA